MYCIHCGRQVDDDQVFCPFCGKKLKRSNEQVRRPMPTEQPPQKRDNRKMAIIIIVIIVAVAIIAVAAFLLLGRGQDSQETAEQAAGATETTETQSVAPAGATEYEGNYYEVVNVGTTWSEAKAECEEQDGHLAIITSPDEESFIEDLIEENRDGDIYHYWLGATDENEEGVWKWLDGQEFWRGGPAAEGGHSVDGMYQHWLPSQPNNSVKENSRGHDYLEIQVTRGNEGADEYLTWTDITNDGVAYGYEGSPDYNDTQYCGYICEWEGDEL